MDFVHYQLPTARNDSSKAPNDTMANLNGEQKPAEGISQEAAKAVVVGQTTAFTQEQQPSQQQLQQPEEIETATRPRLTREQADLLERHFQQYYKPTGNMKRELATATGLSLQRIANWFQNRRAKSKQQKKQEEFERQQLASANAHNFVMGRNPQDCFAMAPEAQYAPDLEMMFHQPMSDGSVMQQMHHMMQHTNYSTTDFEQQAGSDMNALQQVIDATNHAINPTPFEHLPNDVNAFVPMPELSGPPSLHVQPNYAVDPHSAFPQSAFSDWSSRNSSGVWTPARQNPDPFELHHMASFPNSAGDASFAGTPNEDGDLTFNLQSLDGSTQPKTQYLPHQFPSELVHHTSQVQNQSPAMSELPMLNSADSASLSSVSPKTSHTPEFTASPEMARCSEQQLSDSDVFKLPDAPLSIAARRKRPRPAEINGAALRSQSFMGSLPMSPGKSQLLGPTSPMRRIKSTGNNLDLNRGRVQKNISVSGQRSPLNFETFADAGSFDISVLPTRPSLNRAQTTSAVSSSGNLAPPTPMSPREFARFTVAPDSTNCSSNDSEPAWNFDFASQSGTAPAMAAPSELQSDVASPPMTPMHPELQAGMNKLYMTHYSPATLSSGPTSVTASHPTWPLSSPEAPLTSPLFSSSYSTSIPMGPPPAPVAQQVEVSEMNLSAPVVQAPAVYPQVQFIPESNIPGQETHASISLPTGEVGGTSAKIVPEFLFHEPLQSQQPAVPQEHLQKPRNYVFANQGPEDF